MTTETQMTAETEVSAETDVRRFTSESLRAQIRAILDAWGMRSDSAATTADVMVDTDLSAIDSHGVSMLSMYEKFLVEGRLDLNAEPEVVIDGPSFAVVDGHHGLGHPTGIRSMELAIQKARESGIGMVVVRNSLHFGALGFYARMASEHGLLSMVTTTTRTPVTSATGGTTPILGTNPIAFSAPRVNGEPLLVDMSTSVVALNKVKAYANKGKTLPEGWVFDRDGEAVTDATLAYSLLTKLGATISPLGGPTPETGGHKGFGLSLMSQVLSAALSNAAGPLQAGDRDNIGHFFLVINPEALNPGGQTAENVEHLANAMQQGEDGVKIPGDPEREARAERGKNGIPIPEVLFTTISEIAGRASAPMVLTEVV
ncbi:MAG TPA: Ldh family oxidoreductase [Microbacteriaceae bacterium]|nr:Ldh family oxidoreductase [Microbacteriaceae bacterium]